MITPAYSATATERVLPRLALDFTTGSLDARVSVTRALNTATAVNSSGLVATVNADLPRFDYDPVTLVCKGLLVEESRTNYLQYSSRPDLSPWVTVAAVSFTTGAAVAPDGTTTAVYAQNTGSGVSLFQQSVSTAVCGTGTQTCTVYAKANTANQFTLNPYFQADPEFNATFTLTGSGSTNDPTNSKIQAVGNGWYRCSVTYPARAGAGTSFLTRIWPNGRGSSSATGCYFWGFQQEAGAFATSYIATPSAATVTRNADVVQMTGTNFSSWFNATEGTFYINADTYATNQAPARPTLYVSKAGTGDITFKITRPTTATGFTVADDTGAVSADIVGSALANNTFCSVVGAYKANSFAFADRGATTSTDTSGNLPTSLTTMTIGSNASAWQNGHIAKINYWPQRLTNAEVQAFSK